MKKIIRAVKAAAIKNELKEALDAARKMNIHGLEIQELEPLMKEACFKERGNIVLECCRGYDIRHLVYHFPLKFPFQDAAEFKKFDLAGDYAGEITRLVIDTIKEAAYVGGKLKIQREVLVVVHVSRVIDNVGETAQEERRKGLIMASDRLVNLKEAADEYGKIYGCRVKIVRENHPPEHSVKNGRANGLLDYDPRDMMKTFSKGIGINLDLAHFWLYLLYRKIGNHEFSGVDASAIDYPTVAIKEVIDEIAPGLMMLHLNDAGPSYRVNEEGLEIGKGNIFYERLIELILRKAERDLIGTYEIKNGHKDVSTVIRSDRRFRKIFGEKFAEYFE